MAMELNNKEVLKEMGGASMSPVGKGKKLMGVMAMVMAINAFPAPTVQAAEMPLQQNNEIVQLQEFKENFNLTHTEANQKEIINAGYFVSNHVGREASDLKTVVSNLDDAYHSFLEQTETKQRDLNLVNFAKKVNVQYGVEDAPNFLLSSVESPYPTMDELSPLALNTIMAKAESLTGDTMYKPYNSVETAYEYMQEIYNSKVRFNGGADVYNENGEWEDLSMDKADVMKGFVDFSSKGVTEEMKDELPNYLTTYKASSSSNSMDMQIDKMAAELQGESNSVDIQKNDMAQKQTSAFKNKF